MEHVTVINSYGYNAVGSMVENVYTSILTGGEDREETPRKEVFGLAKSCDGGFLLYRGSANRITHPHPALYLAAQHDALYVAEMLRALARKIERTARNESQSCEANEG